MHSACLWKMSQIVNLFNIFTSQYKISSILPLIISLPIKDRNLLYARNQMYSLLTLCPLPFSYSFLHPQTYAPRNVGHKVISSVSILTT